MDDTEERKSLLNNKSKTGVKHAKFYDAINENNDGKTDVSVENNTFS